MSAADCAAAQNAPQTAAGITWSWESTLSQYSKWADHPNLTCDDMDRPDGQLPTGILLQPYMSSAVEGVITPNDQASTNSMVRMCKGLINSDDDQCNMFELQQPKVVNTSEVDPSNNNFSWAVVGTEEAIEANKKIMDQVCDMVDAGGFAVFGVAAHILNSWPTATMAPIVNLGEGPIYPGGRNQTIVDTAKDQGPLAKCELPNLAPWDDGKRTFADVIGDCMHYMDTACAHPKFDEETHRQQICTNLHGPNSYCLSSDLPRQITHVHWEIDGSQVVAQPELFSIDHAIALTRCHDEPNIGMTYVRAEGTHTSAASLMRTQQRITARRAHLLQSPFLPLASNLTMDCPPIRMRSAANTDYILWHSVADLCHLGPASPRFPDPRSQWHAGVVHERHEHQGLSSHPYNVQCRAVADELAPLVCAAERIPLVCAAESIPLVCAAERIPLVGRRR